MAREKQNTVFVMVLPDEINILKVSNYDNQVYQSHFQKEIR